MKTKKTLRHIAMAAAATALALAGTMATTGTAQAAVEKGDGYTAIYDDEPLYPGWHVDSMTTRVIMQSDGNFVVYQNDGSGQFSKVAFASGTVGCGYKAVMQSDGNLVVYSANGGLCWALGTAGHPHAKLMVFDAGRSGVHWNGGIIPRSSSGGDRNTVPLSSDLY
ncbi:hypothetical protein ACFVXG_07965 [Kitasatospora sp. NPDC058162]|uniref:hypothetical protein n=1 Tax=Kitasatospora sp. NPDC058162 TaxID=3346362 RepID=UPI0036DAEF34